VNRYVRLVASTFDVFISYSRSADERLAYALRHALHSFAKPWYRRRALRVFRDDASLSANPALWPSIENALASSRYFVLLASPEAAASSWVEKEIRYWLERQDRDRLLIVVTDGHISWDAGDFDWSRSTALPPVLKGIFTAAPRYVDLRWARAETQLSLRHSTFRDATADIAATVQGRDKDDLIGEDVRHHRRTMRLAWTVSAVLLVLTLTASVLAAVALRQRNEARAELVRAQARQLATEATTESRTGQRARSLLLALESLNLAETTEGWAALTAGLVASGPTAAILREPTTPNQRSQTISHFLRPLAVNPAGTVAATAVNNEVFLWDIPQRRQLSTLTADGEVVVSLAFSPDGRTLAVQAESEPVALWDVKTGKVTGTVGTGRPLFVPESGVLLVLNGGDGNLSAGNVSLWNNQQQTGEIILPEYGGERSIAVDRAGTTLVVAAYGVDLYDLKSRRHVARLPPAATESYLHTVAISPDGATIAAGDSTGSVWLWSRGTPDAAPRELKGQNGYVQALAFSPDGGKLFSGAQDRSLVSWNLKDTKAPRAVFRGHQSEVNGVAIAGSLVVSTAAGGEVLLWELDRPSPLAKTVLRHGDLVGGVAFSPDGRTVVSSSRDHTGRLWNASTGSEIASFPVDDVAEEIQITPDGASVVVLGWAPVIIDISTRHSRNLEPALEPAPIFGNGFDISPDGRRIALAGNLGDLVQWDFATGKLIGKPVDTGQPSCNDAKFAPDGTTLALACSTGVMLWDLASGTARGPVRSEYGEMKTLTFSADGTWLAGVESSRQIGLWKVEDGKLASAGLGAQVATGLSLAFSPDNRVLASGDESGALTLWDVGTRRAIGTLATQQIKVFDLAYHPDGKTLASAGYDGTVIQWNVDFSSWRRLACQVAHRDLTTQEWADFVGNRPYRQTCGDLMHPS
jgi:WD40 repeat protein